MGYGFIIIKTRINKQTKNNSQDNQALSMHTAKNPYPVISVFGITTLPPNSLTFFEYSSIEGTLM